MDVYEMIEYIIMQLNETVNNMELNDGWVCWGSSDGWEFYNSNGERISLSVKEEEF